MKLLTLAVALAFAFALAPSASARTLSQPRRIDPAQTLRLKALSRHWEAITGIPRARTWIPADTRAGLRFWQRRARAVLRYSLHPPHRRAWLCIHRYEGSWEADTGNGYYGGLQADLSFQRAYGGYLLSRKGTANHWKPLEQMWMGERAWRSRGFAPWPNTARTCGLL